MKQEFVKEYVALVKKYGLCWGYDTGWATPDEVHVIDLDDGEVKWWLDDMESGRIYQLNLADVNGQMSKGV